MSIDLIPCPISGLLEILPRIYGDERGYFFEAWSERDFREVGLNLRFVQDNESYSRRGVLRGLHYQKTKPQGKLVRAIRGEVYDVAVDLRPGSATYGSWHGVTLSGERHNLLYIPPGFAHGFLVLSETAIFAYKCTDFYYPEDEGGLAWDDPALDIRWPELEVPYMLSEKDRRNPRLGV